MIPWTTPTITLIVSADLSQATNIIVTIQQGDVFLKKEGTSVTYSQGKLYIDLNETESAVFKENSSAQVQVNWLYLDNGVQKRGATATGKITIGENMLKEVLIGE